MVKEIPLTQGQVALVDDEDHDYLNFGKWHAIKTHVKCRDLFYAQSKNYGLMHRVIAFVGLGIDIGDKDLIDHINGDGLDNRRCNLRVVTPRQNTQNKRMKKSSKYPGVTFVKHTGRWQAIIGIKYPGRTKSVYHNLGYFNSEKKAFEAYKKAVHELTGELLVCELQSSSDDGSGDALKSPLLTKEGELKGE